MRRSRRRANSNSPPVISRCYWNPSWTGLADPSLPDSGRDIIWMRAFAMNSYLQHYIDGQWTDSEGGRRHQVVNPATEEVVSEVTLGSQADVDKAVAAARRAFDSFSQTSKADRIALLGR